MNELKDIYLCIRNLEKDLKELKFKFQKFQELHQEDKLPPLKAFGKYGIADNVSVGSVVMTKSCFDIGLVAKQRDGMPVTIFSRFSEFDSLDDPPRYGAVDAVVWYDTGIIMTEQEWKELSRSMSAIQFYGYWRQRLGIEDKIS